MATDPKYYSDNINLMINLSPGARITNPSTFGQIAFKAIKLGLPFLHALGIHDLFSKD